MSREVNSHRKRKADDLRVPDIKQDGAERKRVLNVLAQRRYRDRKREHLKKLELQVDKNSTCSSSEHEEQGESAKQDEKAQEPTSVSPRTARKTRKSQTTTSQIPRLPTPVGDACTADDFLRATEFEGPFLGTGWTPEAFPETSAFETWATNFLLPAVQRPLESNTLASSQSLPSLTPSASTTSRSSNELPYDDQSFFFPNDSPRPYSPIPGLGMNDLGTTSTITPNQHSLQTQTQHQLTYTFPDEIYLPMLELQLLKGCMAIAIRLDISNLFWDLTAVSPFSFLTHDLNSFTHLPPNLRPTPFQLTTPHHPIFDIFPWPTVRNKLIAVFASPPEYRPTKAQAPMAMLELVYDFEDAAEGVRIWGDDPFDEGNWEVGEKLFQGWWFALDMGVIEKSNRLRKKRGAAELGMGFVTGEV